MQDKRLLSFILIVAVFIGALFISSKLTNFPPLNQEFVSPMPSPTPTPTPRPLTFAEMNVLYGPCTYLPTLMYHHIQDMEDAKTKNQQNLTVDTTIFREQMQYLKDKGYQTLSMADLVNFFDSGVPIPKKSVLITFDDAYDDFYLNVLPILREFGFGATVFTPSGLVNNPGYLSWDQISEAQGANIFFANHTWSHKSMKSDGSIDEKEISTADIQLTERGLNNPKVFAYPYGLTSSVAEEILSKYGYKAAFTTKHGSALCLTQRFTLPRIRIGNGPLSSYGF